VALFLQKNRPAMCSLATCTNQAKAPNERQKTQALLSLARLSSMRWVANKICTNSSSLSLKSGCISMKYGPGDPVQRNSSLICSCFSGLSCLAFRGASTSTVLLWIACSFVSPFCVVNDCLSSSQAVVIYLERTHDCSSMSRQIRRL